MLSDLLEIAKGLMDSIMITVCIVKYFELREILTIANRKEELHGNISKR